MSIRYIYIVALALTILGCAGYQSANLTAKPSISNEYIFFFSNSMIEFQKNSVPVSVRYKDYERQLQKYLNSDPNLVSCGIVPGSVGFGEPGSGGSAAVKCAESLPLVDDTASFYENGEPVQRYRMNIEQ